MYQKFLGIDIGKHDFYAAIHGQKEVNRYPNTSKGFINFYKTHKNDLKNALVVLETTGGYEIELIKFMLAKKCLIHRADTRKVKSFIRSYGKLGKSDVIDAVALAQYSHERHASLELFVENHSKSLLKLVCRRRDLTQMIVQEKNRLKAPDQKELQKSFKAIIKALEAEMATIDEKIKAICQKDESLIHKTKVLETIPGIGGVISIQLIAMMPELGKLNRKTVASLGGLAPHPNESGQKVGYRFTRGGRQEVKNILFMAAMTASRSKSSLGDFYRRLVEAGKKKMVALTALMRKILVIANAKIRDFLLEASIATT